MGNVHVGTLQRRGEVKKVASSDKSTGEPGRLKVELDGPVCAALGQKVTFFQGTQLIGFGDIQGGRQVELPAAPPAAVLHELQAESVRAHEEVKEMAKAKLAAAKV